MANFVLHCLHADQLQSQALLSHCSALCCGTQASFHRCLMDVFFFCMFMGVCVFLQVEKEKNHEGGWKMEDCVRESGSPEMKRWHGVSLWCINGPWVWRRCWDYRETLSSFLLRRNWLITGQFARFRKTVVSVVSWSGPKPFVTKQME